MRINGVKNILNKKYELTIRTKAALFVYLNALVVAVVSGVLIYFLIFNLRSHTIGDINSEIAEVSSTYVAETLNNKITVISNLSNSPFWNNFIKLQDKGAGVYGIPEDEDKKWIKLNSADPFLKKILENQLSLRLQSLVEGDRDVNELFIADRYGYVIAASQKTTDFYQADESWWQESYSGKTFVGDIEFDESSDTVGLIIALPVKNKAGEVIGVCKVVLNLAHMWEFLNDMGVGDTGHVTLLNEQGQVIFHHGAVLLQQEIMDAEKIRGILASEEEYHIINVPSFHDTEIFAIFRSIEDPELLDHGIRWWVVSSQDKNEVFAPLNTIFFRAIIFIFVLTIVIFLFGFLFIGVLIKPLDKLNRAIKHIADGDLDYKIGNVSDDEVGRISREFDKMTEKLKGTTTMVGKLSHEIVERKRAVEGLRKSEERYKTIFESSRDALMTLNPYGKFLSGNPATVKLFACKNEEEFLLKSPADLSPEYQPDGQLSSVKSKEVMKKAIDKGSSFFEWVHQTTAGEEFFATVLITSVKVEDRYILQATVRDITDQKRAFEEITSLSTFMSENPNPVLRISDKGDVIYKNEAVVTILKDEGLEGK